MTRKISKNNNRNSRVFRTVGKKTFNVLEKGIRGVGNFGVGAIRLTGRVVRVGTGAANKVLGSVGRIGKTVSGRVRKSIRRR